MNWWEEQLLSEEEIMNVRPASAQKAARSAASPSQSSVGGDAMKAKLGNEGIWVISEGNAWWTATLQTDGWYILTNDTFRKISPGGRLGKKIVAAIERARAKS
jgi:hypothetical protein